jgi:RNA polymerase subunit RPABC4/transcription elongation factor Spt4
MPAPKYKECRNCGNRNHPQSRQCPFCGAWLRGGADWFSTVGIAVIVLVLVGLVVYSACSRAPSPTRVRLPAMGSSAN